MSRIIGIKAVFLYVALNRISSKGIVAFASLRRWYMTHMRSK